MKEYMKVVLTFCCLQSLRVSCSKNVVLMIADDFRCLKVGVFAYKIWKVLGQILEFMKIVTTSAHLV